MRHASLIHCALGILLISTSLSAGEMRTWTRKNGKEFQAEFVKQDGDVLTLRRPNKSEMTIRLQNLSDRDQKYLEQVSKETRKEVKDSTQRNETDTQKKGKGDKRRHNKDEQLLGGQLTREQFRKAVIGKTPEEIIRAVGKPDSTMDIGGSTWFYRGRTIDPVTGKADVIAGIDFRDGKAESVSFL